MEELKKHINFINEIEKLKTIKRQNFTLDNLRNENSAEHSWQSAIMGMLLVDYSVKPINKNRVIQMLLIHDLGEVYAGDTSLFDDKDRLEAEEKEKVAMLNLIELLPENHRNEIKELWFEFNDGKTDEAKFALAIDAINPLINHLNTAPKNYNPTHLTKERVYEKKLFIKEISPKLWEIAEDTIEKSVQKGLYK